MSLYISLRLLIALARNAVNYHERQAGNQALSRKPQRQEYIEELKKMREGETRVVVEGVIIGQVPTTQKERKKKKKKKTSRGLVAFPVASHPFPFGANDNDRFHALFTIVNRRNRDDKFPPNGNERWAKTTSFTTGEQFRL